MVNINKYMVYLGVSENRLNPIVPNGFADHDPYEKWLAIIGKINPTFSDKPKYQQWGKTAWNSMGCCFAEKPW